MTKGSKLHMVIVEISSTENIYVKRLLSQSIKLCLPATLQESHREELFAELLFMFNKDGVTNERFFAAILKAFLYKYLYLPIIRTILMILPCVCSF